MPVVPGVINNGVISKWLASKPSVTEMLTVDANGNVGRQAIPSAPALAWGNISGTLSAQTDLQDALDGKAPFVHGHVIGDISGLSSTLSAIDAALIALDTVKLNTSAFTFANLGSPPTTLSGYGITDAQQLNSNLTAIAALTTTAYGRSFLTQTNAAAAQSLLGLGTLATQNGTISDYLLSATAASTYLPLAGGTLTGGLIGTTGAFSGNLTTSGVLTVGTVGSTFSRITFAQGVTHTYDIVQPYPEGLLFRRNGQGFAMLQQSTSEFGSYTGGLLLTGGGIAWATNSTIGNSQEVPNLCVMRDATDVLALRRGTNSQTLRIYNAFIDASNYDRGFIRWNSNVFQIGTERLGSYTTTRALSFVLQGQFAGGVLTNEYAGIGVRTVSPAGQRAAFVGNSNSGYGYYSSAIGWEAGATAGFANAIGAFTSSDIDGRTSICPGQGPVHASVQRTGLQTLSALTTDATSLPLAIPNMVGPGTHGAVPIATDHSCTIRGCVVALRDNNTETASFVIDACVQNSGGTVTLVSSSVTQTSNNGNVWSITVNANNTTKRWELLCTGEAGKNIRWSGVFLVAQVAY